jgi:hypothetical protein
MEKYNLFLDDIRDPSVCVHYKTKYMPENRREYTMSDWIVARNYQEFSEIIKSKFASGEFPGLISFDHDLADVHYEADSFSESFEYHEETGADCAKFVVQFCLDHDLNLPEFYIHSANPQGADRIYNNMQDYFAFKERFK